ncbi:SPN1-like protein [Mya arenaria]|uniref:Snurportin-1 n=1 Tax=Mya arenaria TaxID=6604 RepID=A0ABY7DQD3_MYAAR|nr:SPN1-like protein [Mya arenaria]
MAMLMESRWFREIPEQFDTDWVTLACPTGQRCLVMAIDGETKWFSRKGYKLPGYFLSVLPGGNGTKYGFGPTVKTLLDCVYCEMMSTYFILDAITWADHDLTQTPFQERMSWVKRQISQNPELKHITDLNMFKFVPLYHFDCTEEGLGKAVWQSRFETDEVRWIKPYMLPEVFNNMAIPNSLLTEAPADYRGYASFLEDVDNGRVKTKKNKNFKKSKQKKEFVPRVELKLPPPQEKPKKDDTKTKKQNKRGGGQAGRWRGGGSGQPHSHFKAYSGGDNYSRVPYSGGDNRGAFGQGTRSGHDYYGDERDYYYPEQEYGPDYRVIGIGSDENEISIDNIVYDARDISSGERSSSLTT